MSFKTSIYDIVSGCTFQQLCVGTPSQVDRESLLLLSPPFTIIDRYEFAHSPTGATPKGVGEKTSIPVSSIPSEVCA